MMSDADPTTGLSTPILKPGLKSRLVRRSTPQYRRWKPDQIRSTRRHRAGTDSDQALPAITQRSSRHVAIRRDGEIRGRANSGAGFHLQGGGEMRDVMNGFTGRDAAAIRISGGWKQDRRQPTGNGCRGNQAEKGFGVLIEGSSTTRSAARGRRSQHSTARDSRGRIIGTVQMTIRCWKRWDRSRRFDTHALGWNGN